MKVQVHGSLKPPLEYNQDQLDAFDESRFVLTFSTILGVTKILCSFRLVLEEETGKEITESSKLEFLERISSNDFSVSNAEGNTLDR